jgi:MFS transporter, UMF1 family
MTTPTAGPGTPPKSRIVAWALWDCGSTGLSAVAVTFVFSVYLTQSVGAGMVGDISPASWLGRALAIAGVTVAVFAPVIGVWVQNARRRGAALTLFTSVAVVLTGAMSTIRADPSYLFAGLALLAATATCMELASVPYNSLLRQLSTPQTVGRVSGWGWAAGYLGSVVLLLTVYAGFMSGSGPTRGLLGLPVADGHNVRAATLLAGAWLALFASPLLIGVHRFAMRGVDSSGRVGPIAAYRTVWADLRAEWGRDRNLVYYLLASAVFRDGLAGVFAFGAVLGVNVYGVSQADVLLFGVAASVVAAVGAVLGGHVDDVIGPKPVIVGSLAAMVVVGVILLMLSGPSAFWVCGLLLCLFVGPTQSSARTMLLGMCGDGREGVAFGLYTMTGRAVSFLAPWLFFVFVDAFHSDRAGLAGLCVVLGTGLVAVLGVRSPGRTTPRA